ncbi:hypothetical protein BO71DRAFT_394169 [Aspergillus ellipticus CBS 707.79]|uniref:Uncharacterized protein n=1 Tax=Aspergillus ellipticus CBS 707.79 TaxID=1448320 RepID=A0A319DPV4_9EURO|nr:hypothetical protein BO71DRAFT_394169 [Aspergillus ellipticus CBS 707.79]
MSTNPRTPYSVLRGYGLSVSKSQASFGLSLQSVWKPATPHTTRVQTRFNAGLAKEWKGKGSEEHTVNRTKKRDVTDPTTEASASGMKDRAESEGVADGSKSQATTSRGGKKHAEKAKQEHPKAPEPVIGMNDERGQKGH